MQQREWLYLPNVIGYIRICLIILFFATQNPLYKVLFMSANLILDIFDGKVARWLNQTTLFGARFDLIIDMVSLTILSFYAAYLAQNALISVLFILCGINDLINYALSISIFYGKNSAGALNHKQEIKKKGLLLPLYYSGIGLGLANILHDAYLLQRIYDPSALHFLAPFLLIGFVFRQACLVEQGYRLMKLRKQMSSISQI